MSYELIDDYVKVLLGHGADCQIKGGDGEETALHIAARIDEARGDKCSKVTLTKGGRREHNSVLMSQLTIYNSMQLRC